MGAGRGIGKQQRHVLGSHVASVDPIGRARATFDAAGDFALAAAFLARVALDEDRDFGKIARRARRRAGEDHVVHASAAQALWARFAHHPANRFQQIGFAAAVGADDAG